MPQLHKMSYLITLRIDQEQRIMIKYFGNIFKYINFINFR